MSWPKAIVTFHPAPISPGRFLKRIRPTPLAELSFQSSALISPGPDTDNLPVKVIRVKGKNYVIRYPGVCT